MSHRIDANLNVQRFGFGADDSGFRLRFPHAHLEKLDGISDGIRYAIAEGTFDDLLGRLDMLRWQANAVSLTGVRLQDASGTMSCEIGQAEFPRGLLLVRAATGIELLAPHATLSDVKVTWSKGSGSARTGAATPQKVATQDQRNSADAAPAPAPAAASGGRTAVRPGTSGASDASPVALKQEQLRFLDGLAGHIALTLLVKLDLPVVGARTLDQSLRVPVVDGCLDYRALNNSLDWLEGAFVDIAVEQERLGVRWGVPIVAPSRDIVSCALDRDASALAAFGRIPVRSLVDYRIGRGSEVAPPDREKKRSLLQALIVDGIDVALSLRAPRSLHVGNGVIAFGDGEAPGIVNLTVAGSVHSNGPGILRGGVGMVDTTIKDLRLGSAVISADRLGLDDVETFDVAFEGFVPVAAHLAMHRVTASNVKLTVGS